MKLLLFCIFLVAFASTLAEEVDKEENCKCWEDFKPEKGNGGYYCRGNKNHRIFNCGEEKPPICKCLVDGKTVNLDLGETNCLSVDLKNGRWCQNKDEFIQYFKKHPEHAIYD